MCKELIHQIKAIESAKREASRVIRVYETIRGRDDLIAIVEVISSTYLRIMDVHRDGSISLFDEVYMYDEDALCDKRKLARMCDVHPWDIAIEG